MLFNAILTSFYLQTVYFVEPYTLQMHFGLGLTLPSGRNRMVINLVAIDENNVTRPNGICFEVKGDFLKSNNLFIPIPFIYHN